MQLIKFVVPIQLIKIFFLDLELEMDSEPDNTSRCFDISFRLHI